ncbi:hypothetical protein [Allorhodopirellula heiligendammensis]|uniref:Uncharacterized protein n=1 Tax=Allorhodopirellula heiligendammensis TaxID=2714739 RepID=A0A5C6BVN1_9BACT|nr:hypothetical protein [Allorhodopirellula heiligendammensis]TWU16340.1 hypothetical protein Poly21_35450 [Allorhodopirellula heiligendammensis]
MPQSQRPTAAVMLSKPFDIVSGFLETPSLYDHWRYWLAGVMLTGHLPRPK